LKRKKHFVCPRKNGGTKKKKKKTFCPETRGPGFKNIEGGADGGEFGAPNEGYKCPVSGVAPKKKGLQKTHGKKKKTSKTSPFVGGSGGRSHIKRGKSVQKGQKGRTGCCKNKMINPQPPLG